MEPTMRTRARSPRPSGLTIVELLISMAILLVVLMGVYLVFDTNRALYASGSRKMDVQQQLRVALDVMSRQIRMAGFYPERFDADAGTNPSLAAPLRVLAGSETTLVVYGDLDNSNTSNVFLFCRSGSSIIRKRSTAVDAPSAFTCDAGETLASNITGLRFTYYDQNSVPVPDPPGSTYTLDGQALGVVPDYGVVTERDTVRTVVIAITGREDVPGPGKRPQILTLNASVRLRNP
jgi:prepilin-type N-terminal cleavage/methylation domain-containing protein